MRHPVGTHFALSIDVQRAPCLFTTLVALILAFAAEGRTFGRCENSFATRPFSFAKLGLQAPEIEAKFIPESKSVLKRIKDLEGQTITFKGPDGEKLKYRAEFSARHLYEDTCFDSENLELLAQRNMLRQRVRYDLKKGDFVFAKGVHHAKSEPRALDGLEPALFARDEVRGSEFRKKKLFGRNRDAIISGAKPDAAVDFATDKIAANIQPVLQITDRRYFLKLTPVGPSKNLPWFYLSIDKVEYQRLIGAKLKAERIEIEVEIRDELGKLSDADATQKVLVLNALSQHLRKEFGLKASPESKYESGMALTNKP